MNILRMPCGGTDEFSTVEIAGAYAAFGNGGIYTKPHAIKKIVFRDGKTERNMTPESCRSYEGFNSLYDNGYATRRFNGQVLGNERPFKVSILLEKQVLRTSRKRRCKRFMVCRLYDKLYNCGLGRISRSVTQWKVLKENDMFHKIYLNKSCQLFLLGKKQRDLKNLHLLKRLQSYIGSDPLILASASTPRNMKRTELFVRGTVPVKVAERRSH